MKYAISFVLCLSLSGCIGPQFLKVQRYKYNEAIQESTAQQLLLNIVRLRYNDSPMFLNVGDIDARFSLDASSMASGTINENVGAAPLNANSATVTASSKFTNNPNIKLSPMQDADFARLLKPLTPDEMLALAERRTTRYEYLTLAMQSVKYEIEAEETEENEKAGDKEKAAGGDEKKPQYRWITVDAYKHTAKWMLLLKALKKVDEKEGIPIESIEVEEEFLPRYAACEIEAEDVIKAKLAGLKFLKKKHEDEYVLVRPGREWTMKVPVVLSAPPVSASKEQSSEPAQLSQDVYRTYYFSGKRKDESKTEDTERTEEKKRIEEKKPVEMRFRSIVQMMYCLSLGVGVPKPHVPEWDEEEWAGLSADSGILAFRVECGALPPLDAFVSVKYRGYWFYIKRSDMESKKFLSVLTELFIERAGKPATTTTTLAL